MGPEVCNVPLEKAMFVEERRGYDSEASLA